MNSEALLTLAKRVWKNAPSRHNPEAFYVERDEIGHAILNLKLAGETKEQQDG